MRWFILLIVGAFGWAVQVGCTEVTETPAEVAHRQRHTAEVNERELWEDIDTFLLMDEPSHLTKWHVE